VTRQTILYIFSKDKVNLTIILLAMLVSMPVDVDFRFLRLLKTNNMQPYFDRDYATITFDANSNSLIGSWKMPPLSHEFRTYMEALLSAMEHFKTGRVVANTKKMGTLHPDDQEWASIEWTNRAVAHGYSHAAILLPGDVYSQMAVEDTMNAAVGVLTFSYFENMESALQWIKSV
jgi:hypothetical protein